ncbi:MAG: Fe-S cluster assembly ATPase SufC [Acidimicrobiales bacterium]|jgi:Fe-S cluster assembly ATP-binding protein
MSTLKIQGLRAGVEGNEILRGIDLEISSGEVHAIMGPNDSGKSTLSHVIMGRPGYEVLGGTVTLDGLDLLALPPYERARAGLFLALQYPTEVPGVSLQETIEAAFSAAGRDSSTVGARLTEEAERVGLKVGLLDRPLNVDLSGGETKRNETVQLAVLKPKIAILDELDSGLEIDALRACSRRIEQMTDSNLGVLAITRYHRLLDELHPDQVHILVDGRIVASGGPEIAAELETDGYAAYIETPPVEMSETFVSPGRFSNPLG